MTHRISRTCAGRCGDARRIRLFLEDEEYGKDETYETCDVIPSQTFVLHQKKYNRREYGERHHLLYDLQLPYRERTSVIYASAAVGRYHETVFGKCNEPADDDDGEKSEPFELGFEENLAVPGECHEYVGACEQQHGENAS